jgi:hypothetical protein
VVGSSNLSGRAISLEKAHLWWAFSHQPPGEVRTPDVVIGEFEKIAGSDF